MKHKTQNKWNSEDPRLIQYLSLLKKWSKKINLVSKREAESLSSRHISDAETLSQEIKENAVILDIGTGNGFPAVLLSIFRPDIKVYGVERNLKKVIFLKNVKIDINIKNLTILNQPFETMNSSFFEKFDVITWRGVKTIKSIVQKSKKLLKKQGYCLVFNLLDNSHLDNLEGISTQVIHTVDKIVDKKDRLVNPKILKIEFQKP